MDKVSGVYKIQSIIKPERIYIGSSIDIKSRWSSHLSFLKSGLSNVKLKLHCNKYGIKDFEFILIEQCLPEFLHIREQYYIDILKPYFNFYNIDHSNLHAWEDLDIEVKEYWKHGINPYKKLLHDLHTGRIQ